MSRSSSNNFNEYVKNKEQKDSEDLEEGEIQSDEEEASGNWGLTQRQHSLSGSGASSGSQSSLGPVGPAEKGQQHQQQPPARRSYNSSELSFSGTVSAVRTEPHAQDKKARDEQEKSRAGPSAQPATVSAADRARPPSVSSEPEEGEIV